MARQVGSHGNAKRERVSNSDDSKSLTKHNLERFTEATRRQEAQRRGKSTPSPEPNYRGRDDSTLSSRVKARRAPKKATFTSSGLAEEDRITHQVADLFAHINSKPPSGAKPRRSSSLPTETDSGTQKATRLGEGAGGPPLADLKYGIIAVPAGEEAVIFGRQPDQVVSQAFLDAVADARREARLQQEDCVPGKKAKSQQGRQESYDERRGCGQATGRGQDAEQSTQFTDSARDEGINTFSIIQGPFTYGKAAVGCSFTLQQAQQQLDLVSVIALRTGRPP
ncbi:hypothetical protein EDB81DRAFT_874717 [Dactylonectria macrodidyma]|uniref:Uncharacterized protein n=1 Tax=Dactylonectria macrodidyma TaxID=307937 RepID=A0A9P9FSK5_9HYPO|nr:hypothetical protein EDB81DRAFT_874717 [Dactylonectria macrodidyma]